MVDISATANVRYYLDATIEVIRTCCRCGFVTRTRERDKENSACRCCVGFCIECPREAWSRYTTPRILIPECCNCGMSWSTRDYSSGTVQIASQQGGIRCQWCYHQVGKYGGAKYGGAKCRCRILMGNDEKITRQANTMKREGLYETTESETEYMGEGGLDITHLI